jgi:hypothetical protein
VTSTHDKTPLNDLLHQLQKNVDHDPDENMPIYVLVNSLLEKSQKLRLPDNDNFAKYKDVVCCPLKQLYDGSPDLLIPFLNWLDIRKQDEGWQLSFPHNLHCILQGSTCPNLHRPSFVPSLKTHRERVSCKHTKYWLGTMC